MPDERKLVSVDPEYMSALGLASFCFAQCEWQVVWCSEKIFPGSAKKIVSEEMTAGKIGKYFANIVRNMSKSKERAELSSLASEFLALVKQRNRIIHGKPCTAPDGKQRLSGNGIIEVTHLEQAADAFSACSGKLNSLFHGFLQNYVPSQTPQGVEADDSGSGGSARALASAKRTRKNPRKTRKSQRRRRRKWH